MEKINNSFEKPGSIFFSNLEVYFAFNCVEVSQFFLKPYKYNMSLYLGHNSEAILEFSILCI